MTPRRRRPAGQAFYTTALVVTLFTVYSVLRDIGHGKDATRQNSRLALRSLGKRDEEVRLLGKYLKVQILTSCSVDMSIRPPTNAHSSEPIASTKKQASSPTYNYTTAPSHTRSQSLSQYWCYGLACCSVLSASRLPTSSAST
jgi:hypothetical protein